VILLRKCALKTAKIRIVQYCASISAIAKLLLQLHYYIVTTTTTTTTTAAAAAAAAAAAVTTTARSNDYIYVQ